MKWKGWSFRAERENGKKPAFRDGMEKDQP